MYASLIAAAAGFSVRKEKDDVRSDILDVLDSNYRRCKVSSRDAGQQVRRGKRAMEKGKDGRDQPGGIWDE